MSLPQRMSTNLRWIDRISNRYVSLCERLTRHWKLSLVLIFLLSFIAHIIFITTFEGFDTGPSYDGIGYNDLATGLLEGKGYINDRGNPTAYRPPIYPIFLAGIYALSNHSFAAVRVTQALLDTLLAIIIFWLVLLIKNKRIAMLVYLGTAFNPYLIYMSSQIYAETLSFVFNFAAILLLYLLDKKQMWVYALFSGILIGLSVLTRANVVLWIPLVILWVIQRNFNRQTVLNAIILCFGIGVSVGPWVVRNYIQFNAFIPISTLGGANLWKANNDLAWKGGIEPGPTTWDEDDFPDLAWLGWSTLSEIQSDHRFQAKAITWILNNPYQFLMNIPGKVWRTWSPVSFSTQYSQDGARQIPRYVSWVVIPVYLIFLGGAFYGFYKERRKWFYYFPLLAIIISLSIQVILTGGGTRYGIPMSIVLMFLFFITLDSILYRAVYKGDKLD